MPGRLRSDRQRRLFAALADCGTLIFACGPRGVSANLVGEFRVRRHGSEDRLDLADGTNHVHVDWERIARVEVGTADGEGRLTFLDGDEELFRFYRIAGPFPRAVVELAGALRGD